jgi:hypothetical protein
MNTAGPAAPVGWYPDPNMPAQLRYWDGTAWTAHTSPAAMPPPPPAYGGPTWTQQADGLGARLAPPWPGENSDDAAIRRIATYERCSGWAWLVLGIIQVLTVLGIIAGAWNIYAGINRIKMAPRIERREAAVPRAFESLTMYVVIGVINLVFGAVIGLIVLGVDLFIRDQVLRHRHLFRTGAPQAVGAPNPYSQGGTATQAVPGI